MKKVILSATIIICAGILTTSCKKQNDVKPTSAASNFYVSPVFSKQDISSAD